MAEKQRSTSNQVNFNGTINGPVHTGPGDININSFVAGATLSTKEEFIAALRAFKAEIEAAQQHGLPAHAANDVIVEIEAVEREASKAAPQPGQIVDRLEHAKKLLAAGVGLATTVAEAHKLLPLINTAIQTARTVFNI